MIIGGALFGNTFYARADPFEVYSSPRRPAVDLGPPRRAAGASAARWPTSTPRRPTPGLVGVVAVLFGSTAFDAFRESTRWLTFIQGTGYVDVPAEQPRPARLLPRRRR